MLNVSQLIGVTADSPLAISRWIRFNLVRSDQEHLNNFKSDRKSVSDGGFGGAPGFPILSDRDLSFSASCGVARWVINQDHSNP